MYVCPSVGLYIPTYFRRWYQVRVSVSGGQQQRPVVLSQTKSRYKAENLSSYALNCHIGDDDGDNAHADGSSSNPSNAAKPSNMRALVSQHECSTMKHTSCWIC